MLLKILKKVGLLMEFIIGFYATIMLWAMGFIAVLGILLKDLYDGMPLKIIFNLLFLLVFFGGIGIFGAGQLTIKLLFPSYRIRSKKQLKLFLIIGMIISICFIFLPILDNKVIGIENLLITGLPLLVTLHFCYLARGFLWGDS